MRHLRLALRLTWVVVTSGLGRILILLTAIAWLASVTDTERFRLSIGVVELVLAALALIMLPINLRRARARNRDVRQLKAITWVMVPMVGLMGVNRFFPGYHLDTIAIIPLVVWYVVTEWIPRPGRDAAVAGDARP